MKVYRRMKMYNDTDTNPVLYKEKLMPQAADKPRTVLVARFSALGDVAMTIPVVYGACRCHPDTRFVMVTRPSMTSIFVDAPANLTVVGADVKERYAGVSGIATLCRELRAEYTPTFSSTSTTCSARALWPPSCASHGVGTVRIIKPRAKRRALTRRRNRVMLPLTGQRARYREAFFKAGLPIVERFNGLYGGHGKGTRRCFAAITAPAAEGARRGYSSLCGPRRQGVSSRAHGAGGGHAASRRRCGEACGSVPLRRRRQRRRKSSTPGRRATPWCARSPAKNTVFAAELALLNHLDVMLSMDSANMHLAAIANTPTLSIRGATHPYCGFKGWHGPTTTPYSCRWSAALAAFSATSRASAATSCAFRP